MKLPTEPLTLALKKPQFLRLPQPRGLHVAVDQGTLWITIDGQARDIELGPGQRHEFDAASPALLGVLGDAVVFRLLPVGEQRPALSLAWN